MDEEDFKGRLDRIVGDIELAENFSVKIGWDGPAGSERFYLQIACWRMDTFTGEYGFGYGGKAYLSPYASDSELVQTVFGLYKSFWEHEARETFKWRDRRVFGPHIATEALWEVARRVDIRKPIKEEGTEDEG